jgi:arginyl-tRNA synthetase
MQLKEQLLEDIKMLIAEEWQIAQTDLSKLQLSETRKEFEGDYTLVVFPLTGVIKHRPDELASLIGEKLLARFSWLTSFNVVKGFLNLVLSDQVWASALEQLLEDESFWILEKKRERVLVEYASPNTNKPLHLGHVRNFLLGSSMALILQSCGYDVVRTQVINDRGIAICKSMLAWQLFADGATPESTGIKPDHFVGSYYVLFERKFQEEYTTWQKSDTALTLLQQSATADNPSAFFKQYKNTYFNQYSVLGQEAREMLLAWEKDDEATIDLWRKMNQWVYAGFEETYTRYGIQFDQNYYESDTYILGKDIVAKGLAIDIFYQKPDGSVWIDLRDAGLDEKVILRADGTSVYITQDIGTAEKRYEDFQTEKMIYVVADEQNYHFQVLFEILSKLGVPYASGLHHLSYGMVELPEGKMKSREGTVVDADDLLTEVIEEAWQMAQERGELDSLTDKDRREIIEKIGIGALKYFMIKVQPKKKMLFDPKESVDMQGNTGPYIQNAYVRIQSVLRKSATEMQFTASDFQLKLNATEKELMRTILSYPEVLEKAGTTYDPSELANFAYSLARAFHRFYHDCPILSAESKALVTFRLALSQAVAQGLEESFRLLGIAMPNRM